MTQKGQRSQKPGWLIMSRRARSLQTPSANKFPKKGFHFLEGLVETLSAAAAATQWPRMQQPARCTPYHNSHHQIIKSIIIFIIIFWQFSDNSSFLANPGFPNNVQNWVALVSNTHWYFQQPKNCYIFNSILLLFTFIVNITKTIIKSKETPSAKLSKQKPDKEKEVIDPSCILLSNPNLPIRDDIHKKKLF